MSTADGWYWGRFHVNENDGTAYVAGFFTVREPPGDDGTCDPYIWSAHDDDDDSVCWRCDRHFGHGPAGLCDACRCFLRAGPSTEAGVWTGHYTRYGLARS